MKTSKKSLLIVALVSCAVLLASCASSTSYDVNQNLSGTSGSVTVPVKDFEVVDTVFVTAEYVEKVNGEKMGSKITYADLLKKAVAAGGDDVLNVRIDCRKIVAATVTTYEYTGSALAIKYTKAMDLDVMPSSTGLSSATPSGAPGEKKGLLGLGFFGL